VVEPKSHQREGRCIIWHLVQSAQLRRIQATLNQLVQEVEQLSVDAATFDQQLQDLTAAVDELTAAVDAHSATHDLTDESAAVVAATDKVKAATAALTGTAANGQADQPTDTPPAEGEAPPEATQLPA